MRSKLQPEMEQLRRHYSVLVKGGGKYDEEIYSIKLPGNPTDIGEGKPENQNHGLIKFDVGNVVMVTGGRNTGRVGVIKNREKHKGSFETIHVEDSMGHQFATCMGNVFTIGKGNKPWVSLPKGRGIKLSIIEE
ncbi:40S ribosomal protein S4-3 [Zea mays]|uniref:40S ribosomal protein S4-3 n=1 Tax=Zea mays TaxID=4577 RepID=A0A1D6KIZ2_MAIZE|nr:40S ribosomal protein S4-3 [Zea mays]|eukprot:XP_020402801.1 40S ribosomal protein S4-like isoform X2 [Zea mays]